MDTRRRQGNQPHIAASTEAPASGVPDVEVIELTKLPRRSGRSNMAAVIAILSSLTVLVTVASLRPPDGPETTRAPQATSAASPVGLVSSKPTPGAPTPSRTQTPRTPPPPSAPPRTPAPGEWTSSVWAPDRLVYPEGLWAVDGHFLVLARSNDEAFWQFQTSVDGTDWIVQDGPSVDVSFAAGTVIDGRAWFGARIPGLTESDARWELASTLDGASWDILGDMHGWGIGHGIGVLDHVGDTWIATRYLDGTDETSMELLWSGDGENWTVPSIPVDPRELGPDGGWLWFGELERIGDKVLIRGGLGNYERTIQFVLTSRDGRSWSRTTLSTRPDQYVTGLACSADRCVMPAQISRGTGTVEWAVFVSTDGRSWRESVIDLQQAVGTEVFARVIAIPTGFLAVAGGSGAGLVSDDGVDWRPVQLLPPQHPTGFGWIGINGNMAGGFDQGDGIGNTSPLFWHGPVPSVDG